MYEYYVTYNPDTKIITFDFYVRYGDHLFANVYRFKTSSDTNAFRLLNRIIEAVKGNSDEFVIKMNEISENKDNNSNSKVRDAELIASDGMIQMTGYDKFGFFETSYTFADEDIDELVQISRSLRKITK